MSEKKMTSSRRHHLKSLVLSITKGLLEKEVVDTAAAKEAYMAENCAPLSMPSSTQDLQELCKKLHQQIDKVDEERYDLESKVGKAAKEIEDLKIKVVDLQGKFKKPALKKVRLSADQMLQALLGSKHKVSLDLRANLKQVKKEVKEEAADVGDWRKNIEDKAGMGGRKKMFEGEAA
ncbi:troponin I type 2a (skeletal, fast), tandem duplicate 3 isoform X1 [Danio rerio]|uniref:Troponin I, fast skeletal muscle n=8 Tax=Danio rerio TaxID=7955 RepID=Q6DHU6_DANRE|nr:troponin I type 2a (skeletal, fast), tandem duplicate 3 [Danio rerio]AAH75871.1 Troponin I, skeletal, fast 2a.3 [Danio rerio]|eukprot:NP_991138.2 troponin I, skeletal, fast [Danio rerio]